MNSPVPQKTSFVQRLDRRVIGSRPTRFVQAATVVAALSMLVPGVWMRIDPASFARLANFPVHDEHFLRDAGVFQIGIGLMMLGTLPYRDLSAVVLAGFVFTNTFHAINHALDRHIGGNDSDWWMLALVSVLVGAALVVRLRHLSRADRRAVIAAEQGRVAGAHPVRVP